MRRVRKTVNRATRRYVYDEWNLVREVGRGTVAELVRTNYYVWGLDVSGTMRGAGGVGGLLAASLDGSRSEGLAFGFYVYDGNGNVTEVVDSNGVVVAHYEYDPYGNVRSRSGAVTTNNPFRFSTKYADEEAGLVYYGYRFYSPELGRWMSRDPVGERGGLNLYVVVRNGVPNAIDPLGLTNESPGFSKPGPSRSQGLNIPKPSTPANEAQFTGILSCLKEVWNQYKKLLGNCGVPGFEPSNPDDKLQHCLSSCELTKSCGSSVSEFLGFGKEWRDEIWKMLNLDDEGACLEDFMANSKGRDCAEHPAGCECCCKNK